MKHNAVAANDDGESTIEDMKTAVAFADYLALTSAPWSGLAAYLFRLAAAELKAKIELEAGKPAKNRGRPPPAAAARRGPARRAATLRSPTNSGRFPWHQNWRW
jgi:hypothetical protein